ncbi:MAG TPA: hypothetical protein DCY79_18190 [Planctomycetaceae bacterium]|nr:hypothetical protein [Blastopirellula sp.]HAY81738.1 hypothetical protein [Planctomycetaceae bacterium]|tara:strand:- start:404 stop:1795 length:1392 start_codon:yes stop_codon:yes gene_type:complete
MSTLSLVFAEIRFRLTNFILCALAVVIAATMFVAGPMLLSGYAAQASNELAGLQAEADDLQRAADEQKKKTEEAKTAMTVAVDDLVKQTKRIMRDIGVNLRIVHEETNMGSLYTDFEAHEFPEDYVHRLAQAESIETIVHLVATLQHRMKWNDRTVLLVGTLPVLTTSQKNAEKPHMVQEVEPGTVWVGSELAGSYKPGDKIKIGDVELTIAKIMPEQGTLADVQLVVHLDAAQEIANKPDQINQIMALNCKCKGDRISVIRKELEGVLPDTKITEDFNRATAREKQRDLTEAVHQQQVAAAEEELARAQANLQRAVEHASTQTRRRQRQQTGLNAMINIGTPVVVFLAAIFIALMTWQNVRDRRAEIGILRALGKATKSIAGLLLAKAVIVGATGGVIGCLVGVVVANQIGASMQIAPESMTVDSRLLWGTIVGAPLVAAIASYLPTLSALRQDPARVLMDQ